MRFALRITLLLSVLLAGCEPIRVIPFMKIIVGLGNPGEEYRDTPHNLGFAAVDALAEKYGGSFAFYKKFNAETAKIYIGREEILLLKPRTFMNLSGRAVLAALNFYKLLKILKSEKYEERGFNSTLLVIHDDLDLPLGKSRVSFGVGPAGHKGVISVIESLGIKNFARLRIGIAKEDVLARMPAENYVLAKFSEDDKKIVNEAIAAAPKIIEVIEAESMAAAMSAFN